MPAAPSPLAMTRRRLALLALVAGPLAAAACDDPFQPEASSDVVTDTLVVYALSGTAPSLPAALNIADQAVVRVNGNFGYDVVFDLDAQNRVLLYPVRLIGGPFAASRTVGIQRFPGAFDQATKAPNGGYQYDSVAVLAPGEGVYLQIANNEVCQFDFSRFLFSKIVVDSVAPSIRAIYLRAVHDPNCGFRTLTPGRPKD